MSLDTISPHDVAGLLKQYFRELPGGLFPTSCSSVFVQVCGTHRRSEIGRDIESVWEVDIWQVIGLNVHKYSSIWAFVYIYKCVCGRIRTGKNYIYIYSKIFEGGKKETWREFEFLVSCINGSEMPHNVRPPCCWTTTRSSMHCARRLHSFRQPTLPSSRSLLLSPFHTHALSIFPPSSSSRAFSFSMLVYAIYLVSILFSLTPNIRLL